MNRHAVSPSVGKLLFFWFPDTEIFRCGWHLQLWILKRQVSGSVGCITMIPEVWGWHHHNLHHNSTIMAEISGKITHLEPLFKFLTLHRWSSQRFNFHIRLLYFVLKCVYQYVKHRTVFMIKKNKNIMHGMWNYIKVRLTKTNHFANSKRWPQLARTIQRWILAVKNSEMNSWFMACCCGMCTLLFFAPCYFFKAYFFPL